MIGRRKLVVWVLGIIKGPHHLGFCRGWKQPTKVIYPGYNLTQIGERISTLKTPLTILHALSSLLDGEWGELPITSHKQRPQRPRPRWWCVIQNESPSIIQENQKTLSSILSPTNSYQISTGGLWDNMTTYIFRRVVTMEQTPMHKKTRTIPISRSASRGTPMKTKKGGT